MIKLGNYKKLGIDREIAQVTDDDIEKAKEKLRAENVEEMRLLQRPVEEGDTVKIDFEGFIDGAAFEGGRGDNYDLVIGSGSFIEGFEEQIIGSNVGDSIEVVVKFPVDYGSKDVAGKEAVFKTTIKEIKRQVIPEFGLPLVIVATDFDSVEAFIENAKIEIAAQKQEQLDARWQNILLDKIIDNSEILISGEMVEKESEQLFREYTNSLAKDGVDIETYLEYVGLSGQQFLDQLKMEARKRLQCRAVLKAAADAEGISVSDEELEEELQRAADKRRMPVKQVRKMLSDEDLDVLKEDILMQKAMRMIMKVNL